MAVHANLSRGHIRVSGDLDKAVAVTAVHSHLLDMDIVGKRNRLNRLIAHVRVLIREIVRDSCRQSPPKNEETNEDFNWEIITPAREDIRHASGLIGASRERIFGCLHQVRVQ